MTTDSRLDLDNFYQACNPSKTLDIGKPEDRQYYVDFSPVRGSQIIKELERTITILRTELSGNRS